MKLQNPGPAPRDSTVGLEDVPGDSTRGVHGPALRRASPVRVCLCTCVHITHRPDPFPRHLFCSSAPASPPALHLQAQLRAPPPTIRRLSCPTPSPPPARSCRTVTAWPVQRQGPGTVLCIPDPRGLALSKRWTLVGSLSVQFISVQFDSVQFKSIHVSVIRACREPSTQTRASARGKGPSPGRVPHEASLISAPSPPRPARL